MWMVTQPEVTPFEVCVEETIQHNRIRCIVLCPWATTPIAGELSRCLPSWPGPLHVGALLLVCAGASN